MRGSTSDSNIGHLKNAGAVQIADCVRLQMNTQANICTKHASSSMECLNVCVYHISLTRPSVRSRQCHTVLSTQPTGGWASPDQDIWNGEDGNLAV